MSRTSQRILLVSAVGLVVLIFAARLRYSGKAPVKLPADNCDARLWDHVYSPERLRVLETCTAVEGRVVSVQRASDGDLHIALEPDSKSVLNLVNATHARGHLVVELICDHTATGIPSRQTMLHFEFGGDRLAEPHPLKAFELRQRAIEAPFEARFVAEEMIELRR